MIRVLQLLDTEPDYQTETGARQLAEDASGLFHTETRAIGRGGRYPTVARAIMSLRRDGGDFDLVHAWGPHALAAAALGLRRPLVYSPVRFPNRREIRFVRAVLAARDLQIIASTDTIRRAFVTRGVPIERCHLIRPGVEFAKIQRRRNGALREALGFAPQDHVFLACGESTGEASHQLALWSASIVHLLDPANRLLLWGRGDHAEQAQRFAMKTHQHGLMEVAERNLARRVQFEELLGAADAVLVTATAPVPTLPIANCMAAGLPIVAVVTPTVAELLEDRHTALMVGKPRPRLIAQRILDLQSNPSLQWSIADAARTEAYEFFSLTRFLNQYRTVYRQIAAAERVAVPPQAPGAGMRFLGRA